MRGVEKIIVMAVMFIFPVIFHKTSQLGTFGLPEDQACPYIFFYCEQFEFLAEFTVISFFCLFKSIEMFFQLFLVEKRGSVNALQDIIFFISTPIGTSHSEQLERFDKRSVGKVRTTAEIGKVSNLVEGYGITLQILDKFDLIFFIFSIEPRDCFTALNFCTGKRKCLAYKLLHFSLNLVEIFRTEWFSSQKIVIKTVFNRGTDSYLYIRSENFPDSQCHNMGSGVAQDIKSFIRAYLHRA